MVEETLFQNEWVSLKKIVEPKKGVQGYVYSHETRCLGIIISVLPFRRIKTAKSFGLPAYEFLLREELTPCWSMDKKIRSTITGGFEGHLEDLSLIASTKNDAQRELKEEAGYSVDLKDFIFLGNCYASKSSDTVYALFGVDLTDVASEKAEGDGSLLEKQATTVWCKKEDILICKDPLASVLYLRLYDYLLEHNI